MRSILIIGFLLIFNLTEPLGNTSHDSINFQRRLDRYLNQKIPDSVLLTYIDYTFSLFGLKNYTEAEVYLLEAINYMESDSIFILPHSARLYGYLGFCYYKQKAFQKALKYHEYAYALFQLDLKYQLERIKTLHAIAFCHLNLNNTRAALSYFQSLLKSDPSIVNQVMPLASIYQVIGQLYADLSDFEPALQNLHISKDMFLVERDSSRLSLVYNEIGNVYLLRKEFNKAEEYYRSALKMGSEGSAVYNDFNARVYNNIGVIYELKEEYQKALEVYKTSFKQMDGSATEVRIKTILNISLCYNFLKNLDSLHHYNQFSVNLLSELEFPDEFMKSLVYYHLSLEHRLKRNLNDAVNYLKKSLDVLSVETKKKNSTRFLYNSKKQVYLPHILECLLTQAEILPELYQSNADNLYLNESMNLYREVIEILEFMRLQMLNEYSKLFLNENFLHRLKKSVRIMYIWYKDHNPLPPEEILSFNEQFKSAILSSIIVKKNRENNQLIPNQIKWSKDSIETRIEELHKNIQVIQLNEYSTDSVHKKLIYQRKEELFSETALRHLNRQIDSIIDTSPESTKPVTFELIQSELDSSAAILNYLCVEDELYCILVNKHKISIIKLIPETNLQILVSDYLSSLKKFDFVQQYTLSRHLYNILLAPLIPDLQTSTKLIIIPDSYLFNIPFESLMNNKKHYLIEDYVISYHYSPTLWYLGTINSSYQSFDSSFVAFAPSASQQANQVIKEYINNSNALAGFGILKNLQYLPESKVEIETIGDYFRGRPGKIEIYLNERATESCLKEIQKKARIIHIAAHSFVNNDVPYLSGLIFYPDSIISGEKYISDFTKEDGILFVREIYNFDLGATDLVVLSSCESGIDKQIIGEGMISLNRAFLSAGANNTLFTLWKVLDEPTKIFMQQFYTNLLENSYNYTKALQQTKIDFLKSAEYKLPSYWSGFLLLGN